MDITAAAGYECSCAAHTAKARCAIACEETADVSVSTGRAAQIGRRRTTTEREPNPPFYRLEAKRELTGLLGEMGRAHGFEEPTLAVLRVVAFTMPQELRTLLRVCRVNDTRNNVLFSLLLPGHCHVPPPCSPPLEPLTAELPASSEYVALLVDTLARLGTDALALTLLRRMTLRAKRAAACSCRGLRTLIAPHLRAATLHVLAEDATLDNAAFVARLPTLERLHVEGESFLCDGLDIPKLRSLPRIALKTIGAPAALFLGCLLSGGDHTIRLSNGLACISLKPITMRDDLSLVVTAAADLAVLLGSLSSNRVLKRLGLPLIIFETVGDKLDALTLRMAAVGGLGEMVVQLGQALIWSRSGPDYSRSRRVVHASLWVWPASAFCIVKPRREGVREHRNCAVL